MVTVYSIRNVENGKHYVGCTAGKPQKRWREHRCLLRAGKHACGELQADWIKSTEQCFALTLLEAFDGVYVARKRERELFWMDHFGELGLLYNEHRISFQPPPGYAIKSAATRRANGYRHSPESNLARRLAQLGVPKGHGAKISATKQARKLQ